MPLSRRRIDLESLSSVGGTPIYPSKTDASNTSKLDDSPIGIQINQWSIITQNSTIGDEKGMNSLTSLLEDAANSSVTVLANDATAKRRRLCPPEITFLNANISLQYNNTEIRFNAIDALMEWAEAHRYLDHTISANASQKEYRGVKIMQTKDAEVWSEKSNKSNRSSEFYYDWTFATPYSGSIQSNAAKATEVSNTCINNRRCWKQQNKSSIPLHLLQDTSQPILLYDDVTLFEDDLHDNGDVSLNIKIRVMPSCWYVLQRLFVRVDHVCLKVREVRMFCYFGSQDGAKSSGVEANTVYRDVSWREATFEDLSKLGLPTDPARWRNDGEKAAVVAQMIGRLPGKDLPNDLPRHSCFRLGER